MASSHLAVDLAVDGHNIGVIEIPVKLQCGDLADGVVPVSVDATDFAARIKRGVAAFARAVV